ncbi:MAG: helix-turn-helix domain-containing protein [Paludibacter sp.]
MDELERIKKIMQTEELNSAQFAAEIGIQGSTLSHILNGRNNPSLDVHKKILNRFRSVSSDWLILGVGSMYRSEKQSQSLTLFDNLDDTISKSTVSEQKTVEKLETSNNTNQQNTDIIVENSTQTHPIQQIAENRQQQILPKIELPSKSVNKIIVYYTDNTFQEFESK